MYRYMERQYLEKFMKYGSIRVGTLYNFRASEHKKGIADPYEGMKNLHHLHKNFKFTAGEPLDLENPDAVWFARGTSLGGLAPGTTITLTGTTLEQTANEIDCHVLCSSSECSVLTMQQFEGADCCIEIQNVEGFLRCLSETLAARLGGVKLHGIAKVAYQERLERWNQKDLGISAGLIKTPDFQLQKEIRAIWTRSTPGSVEPVVVNDCRLPQFCRVVDLIG